MNSSDKQDDQADSTWNSARVVGTHEANDYAEWVLLVTDLEYARRRAELWGDMARDQIDDQRLLETATSVFRDTVVSFVACFDRQSPVFLDAQAVYADVPGGLEYVKWLRDLRNTWIAHRGGPLRQCVVAVHIDEQSGDLVGLGPLQLSYVGPKPEAAGDLVRVMEIAVSHARRERDRRQELIRSRIEAMPSPARLVLPLARTVVPRSEDVRLGRKRHQRLVAQTGR